jgi:hypothetical protein
LKYLGSQMVDYGLKFFFKGTYAHTITRFLTA